MKKESFYTAGYPLEPDLEFGILFIYIAFKKITS
jgi:hypothetical protein